MYLQARCIALAKGVRIGKGLKPIVSRDFNTIISLSVAIFASKMLARTLVNLLERGNARVSTKGCTYG